jgi:hypothetical protein
MPINPSSRVQAMIDERMRRGGYANIDDLLIAALIALDQQSDTGNFAPREPDKLLSAGDAEIDRGEAIDGHQALIKLKRNRKKWTEAELLKGVTPDMLYNGAD